MSRQGLIVGLIRPLNESGQKNNSPCSRATSGRGREKHKPSFPHSIAWTFSTAEGLVY
jgi:hypothetical protein